jgi:signal transduction histidine kinase
MSTIARRLFEPMNLAAYAAWAAIGIELWATRPGGTGLLAEATREPAQFVLYLAFLALFVGRQLFELPRHAAILVVLAQALVAMALAAIARAGTAPILLVIAFAQMAQLLSPRQLALAFVLANAALYGVFRFAWQMSWPAMATLLHASFQLFAIVAAWYAVTAERSRDALAAANAELLATRSLLAESARDSERLRLSRELHDVAGHSLTALKLNLRALQRRPDLAGDAQLALCARLADELLADIRGLVQQMRLHDGVELGELVQRLAAPFPKPRLHVEFEDGLRVPSLDQAEAVLRTVQEALTNAARHGGADNLWLYMRREDGQLRLDIRDDGRGAGGTLHFGNGLRGMRERLQAMGGGVEAEGGEQRGVHLAAWLPLVRDAAPDPLRA